MGHQTLRIYFLVGSPIVYSATFYLRGMCFNMFKLLVWVSCGALFKELRDQSESNFTHAIQDGNIYIIFRKIQPIFHVVSYIPV